MLQIDPMKRATAEDIHKHEWFQKDLPTYLFPDRDADVQMMDHETINVVCEVIYLIWKTYVIEIIFILAYTQLIHNFLILIQKFKVDRSEVEEALNSGDYHNHLAIAYRLIMDNKRIEDETTIEEFK